MLVFFNTCRRIPLPQGSIEEFTLAGTSPKELNLKVCRNVHIPIIVMVYCISGRGGPGPGDYDPFSGKPNVGSSYALQTNTLLLVPCRLISSHQKAKGLRLVLAM